MTLEIHEAADEFPMFDDVRLKELVDDIRLHGQKESIKLYCGKILDGRNRYKACLEAGMTPRTEDLPDDLDPWAYVWSLNGQRRDLGADQRYLIWRECNTKSATMQLELYSAIAADDCNAYYGLCYMPPVSGVWIYALYDPREPEIVRYVGRTANTLTKRLGYHINNADRGMPQLVLKWIRSIFPVRPHIRALLVAPRSGWQEYERILIRAHLSPHLMNDTMGGCGSDYPEMTRENIQIQRLERRERMLQANRKRMDMVRSNQRLKKISSTAEGVC